MFPRPRRRVPAAIACGGVSGCEAAGAVESPSGCVGGVVRVQRQSNGELVRVTDDLIIGRGGEATVYGTALKDPRPLVAKIWRDRTPLKARKLAAMLKLPPPASRIEGHTGSHVSIAWPVDVLVATRKAGSVDEGVVVGYLMPQALGTRRLVDFYNPASRRQNSPNFNYRYLIRTARNLAAAVTSLHARGVVIGDVNESNILVAETALATLVDTDSFQVRDPETGDVFRCRVGKLEYTPPELQDAAFDSVERTPAHDRFGLAVLIFQLLMEGTHPFSGVFIGAGDPPPLPARIRAGHFPYVVGEIRSAMFEPIPAAPPISLLSPPIRHLFERSFLDGHHDPKQRPTANEWREALDVAERELRECRRNPNHLYGTHLPTCPWCSRAAQLAGRDPFPMPMGSETHAMYQIRQELAAADTDDAKTLPPPPPSPAPRGRSSNSLLPAFIPPSPITAAQQARGLRIYSVGLLLMAASMVAVAFAQIRLAVDPPTSVVAVTVAALALMGSICVQAVGLGHCTSGGHRDSLVWALIGLVAVPFTFVSWPISLGLALRFVEGFAQNQITGLPTLRRTAFAAVLVPLSILAAAVLGSSDSIGGLLLAYAYLVGLLAFIAAMPMWRAASHIPKTP